MKINKTISLAIAAIALCSLTACSTDSPNGEVAKTPVEIVDKAGDIGPSANTIEMPRSLQELNISQQSLAFRVFDKIREPGTNRVFSPLSLSMALSMLANGAEGETLDELMKALNGSSADFSKEDLNEYCKIISRKLPKVDETYVNLSLANSLWTNTGLPVKNSYMNVLSQYFDASAHTADLSTPQTLLDINSWISEKTKGMIPEFLSSSPQGVLLLINALSLDAKWTDMFSDFNAGEFNNYDKTVSSVQMMNKVVTVRFSDNEKSTAFEIPYGKNAYCMKVIMPKTDGFTPDEYSINEIDKCLYNNEKSLISLSFPSFKLEDDYMLKETLMTLGVKRAFSRNDAQFGAISSAPLYVDMIKQKAIVSVDCEKTSAAAATLISMETSSGDEIDPIPVVVDRPFYFIIEEKSSGIILFIGKVAKL